MRQLYYKKLIDCGFDIETIDNLDVKNKTTIIIRVDKGKKEITIADVCKYYKEEAPNIYSGCRTFAGIVGDWRPIDQIAHLCLKVFKAINIETLLLIRDSLTTGFLVEIARLQDVLKKLYKKLKTCNKKSKGVKK